MESFVDIMLKLVSLISHTPLIGNPVQVTSIHAFMLFILGTYKTTHRLSKSELQKILDYESELKENPNYENIITITNALHKILKA